ncbi:hypothetical protein PJI17_31120, partial [Mycobacterium kansasii]
MAERKNRHIVETANTLMTAMSVPRSFWAEAMLHSVYLINRMPTKVLNSKSPYFVLTGLPPAYFTFRVFGCICYVHLASR